jgi:hypothetical protein
MSNHSTLTKNSFFESSRPVFPITQIEVIPPLTAWFPGGAVDYELQKSKNSYDL